MLLNHLLTPETKTTLLNPQNNGLSEKFQDNVSIARIFCIQEALVAYLVNAVLVGIHIAFHSVSKIKPNQIISNTAIVKRIVPFV